MEQVAPSRKGILRQLTDSTVDQPQESRHIGSLTEKGDAGEKVLAKKPFVVSIEGNIGAGKSTMISYFKNLEDVQIHPEPVGKWQNLHGENLLEKLYLDPKRWSFQFQSYIQLTRLQELKAPLKEGKRVRILERSIQSNRYCFLELARGTNLCKEESIVLEEWFDWMETHMSLDLDLIVYLRTKPEIAYERMLKRGRAEETGNAGPPLVYLEIVHKAYEEWLMNERFGRLKPKILVLDANQDLSQMRKHYEEYEDQIRGLRADRLDLCVQPVSKQWVRPDTKRDKRKPPETQKQIDKENDQPSSS